MNLRILKKLSKRAAILLTLMGDDREQFRAERLYNYGMPLIPERKHWDRTRCHATYEGRNDWSTSRGAQIVFTTRAGRRMVMGPPSHPRAGTMMVGATTGYYEPEWSEETAWCALEDQVRDHFCDWDEDGPKPLRQFNGPGDIFRAAQEIIAERELAAASRKGRAA